jgi:hypothetical protein
LEAGAKSDLSI